VRIRLTLEPDVADRLKQEMRRARTGLRALVNEALRLGLGLPSEPPRPVRYKVRPHSFGFRPRVDLDRMNQFADQLEAVEAARKLGR